MTREEAILLLETAKRVLEDMRMIVEAGEAEDTAFKLEAFRMSREDARVLSYMLLPNGHRGHVRLVLLPPRCARALAFIVGVLRAFADDQ